MAGVGGSGTTILNQIEMATVPSQQGLNQNLLSKISISIPESSARQINPVFFDEIIDRMDEVGFYCSGFQKDPKNNKTILWFKPEDL